MNLAAAVFIVAKRSTKDGFSDKNKVHSAMQINVFTEFASQIFYTDKAFFSLSTVPKFHLALFAGPYYMWIFMVLFTKIMSNQRSKYSIVICMIVLKEKKNKCFQKFEPRRQCMVL